MPKAQSYGEAYTPFSPAPGLQLTVPPTQHGILVANTVPASGNVVSNPIETDGWPRGAVAVQSTQTGVLSIQLYLDDACTIPTGSAITAALTANTLAVANVPNTTVFAAMVITITNTGGSAATLSKLVVLLST